MNDLLNDDDPDATFTRPDGAVVRNLTPEEYDATYADGTPCNAPPEELLRSLYQEEGEED